MRALVATLFLVVSCGTPVPGYGATQEGGPYTGAEVAEVMDDFVTWWDLLRGDGDEVRAVLDNLDVLWSDTLIDGRYFGTADRVGSAVVRGRVRVFHVPGQSIRTTALAHELAHISLGATHRDMDRNHADPPGPWDDSVDTVVRAVRGGGS